LAKWWKGRGVQPANAELAENVVPINVAGLELDRRRVTAV